MKIAIIGPGAMGTLFAARLYQSAGLTSSEILLIDKNSSRAKTISNNGITVSGLSKIRIKSRKLFVTAKPSDIRSVDLLIFFVKAYDTLNAAKAIAPFIGRKSVVLTLQNGFGNAEAIKGVFEKHLKSIAILAGTTSEAATLESPGKIRHTGKGKTVFGWYAGAIIMPDHLKNIANILNYAGIKTSLAQNVKELLWSKLVINSAINPLGTITFKKNGELLKDNCLKELLFLTARESAKIARHAGIRLLYNDPEKKVEEVCRKTAQNYNSMLQDIMRHKKTEVDYINGAVIKTAQKHRPALETPLNKMLYCLIKLIERQYGTSSKKTLSQRQPYQRNNQAP